MLHRALRLIRQYHKESLVDLSTSLGIPKEKIVETRKWGLVAYN